MAQYLRRRTAGILPSRHKWRTVHRWLPRVWRLVSRSYGGNVEGGSIVVNRGKFCVRRLGIIYSNPAQIGGCPGLPGERIISRKLYNPPGDKQYSSPVEFSHFHWRSGVLFAISGLRPIQARNDVNRNWVGIQRLQGFDPSRSSASDRRVVCRHAHARSV